MSFQELASLIANREGLKSQVKIGDVREIVKILIALETESLNLQDSPGFFLMTQAANKLKSCKKRK